MSTHRFTFFIVATSLVASLAGCSKGPSGMTNAACADLDKTTDPVKKAELLKTCPPSGAESKASSNKGY